MTQWPPNPKIYEINTWVWLSTLSEKYNRPISLADVPEAEINEIASYQIDAVWMMGVWHRGPATRASALNYIHEYRGALPDIKEDDVVGSAYAIHNYEVDPALGGRKALDKFRKQLKAHDIKLILDFVPNHVSVDHPWIAERPDYFITGTARHLREDSGNFFPAKDARERDIVIAHGRDPYFPGWIDTAQLNAFSPGYREAAINTLKDIASQADGVRCDMAMLMMNDVFHNTWGWLGVEPMAEDFWSYVVPKVRLVSPNFLFIAETYWGLDYALHLEGFDYTYDKTMYDRLVNNDVAGIYSHLIADINFLKKNIRFIENHDEPRAMISLGLERSRPAATLICTLPGATLLHDGQFTGRKVKLPVQINRQPDEQKFPNLYKFYMRLLKEARAPFYQHGEWRMFSVNSACDGCQGHDWIIAYGWRQDDDFRLIALNMSSGWSQGRVDVSAWRESLEKSNWKLYDIMHQNYSAQAGADMVNDGLQVDLEPYSVQILHFKPTRSLARYRERTQST